MTLPTCEAEPVIPNLLITYLERHTYQHSACVAHSPFPMTKALPASSSHREFRAQSLGLPGVTSTISWEQGPCFCGRGWGRGLEPYLLNFLASAQKPTLEASGQCEMGRVNQHSTHMPCLGWVCTLVQDTISHLWEGQQRDRLAKMYGD